MDKWIKAALGVIDAVDYDIGKDAEANYEDGETDYVEEIASYLKSRFKFKEEQAND